MEKINFFQIYKLIVRNTPIRLPDINTSQFDNGFTKCYFYKITCHVTKREC